MAKGLKSAKKYAGFIKLLVAFADLQQMTNDNDMGTALRMRDKG